MITQALIDEHNALCLRSKSVLSLPEGPWDHEPHRVDFEASGLHCLLLRNHSLWNWCGYVGVPPGHPAYGKSTEELDLDVHGGLTYADECTHYICHIREPWEPENLFWLGFDCCHAYDLVPGMITTRNLVNQYYPYPVFPSQNSTETYRDLSFVRYETEHLAKQLSVMRPQISLLKRLG